MQSQLLFWKKKSADNQAPRRPTNRHLKPIEQDGVLAPVDLSKMDFSAGKDRSSLYYNTFSGRDLGSETDQNIEGLFQDSKF